MSRSEHFNPYVIAMIQERTSVNPIKSSEIERRLSISGVTVRQIIHDARTHDNVPICSDSKGYYIASNKIEADATIRQLLSRAKQLRDAAEGMEKHYNKDNQMRLI